MRRWFYAVALALAVAAVGCEPRDGERPRGDGKGIIGEQKAPDEPGPGGAKVKAQAKEIADAIKKDLESKSPWAAGYVSQYGDAVEEALVEWVQSSSGLDAKQKEELINEFPAFVELSLPRSVNEKTIAGYVNAAEYCVEMYAGRIPVNQVTQDRIDAQIDTFCEELKPALKRLFSEHSSIDAISGAPEDIRKGLKECSRNPWFPALKEPLDDEEEPQIKSQIVEQTLVAQLDNFKKAKEEGRRVAFDWADTSAWSAATKFVSKTIKPPSDRSIMFTHSPGMPGIGVQIRPPMMAPQPGGGVAPAPGAPIVPPPPSPGPPG